MSEYSLFLYWCSGNIACWRLQIVLEEKNVKYGAKMLEKAEHQSAEILILNQRGQVIQFMKSKVKFYLIVKLATDSTNRKFIF